MSRTGTDLMKRCIDGAATESERGEFVRMLAADDSLLDAYCEEIRICSALEWHFSIESDLKASVRRRGDLVTEMRRRQQQQARWVGLAAAAAIMLLAALYGAYRILDSKPSASFVGNEFAEWEIRHADGNSSGKQKLSAGDRIDLERGALELSLQDGVHAILEGPADLTLAARGRVILGRGQLSIEVRDEAGNGFTVESPGLRATDLGTRFGILCVPGESDEVHVFEGHVEVAARHGTRWGSAKRLGKGQAVRNAPGLPGILRSFAARPSEFSTELPSGLPGIHISFDEPAKGDLLAAISPWPTLAPVLVRPGNAAPLETVDGILGKGIAFPGDGTHIRIDGWPGITDGQPRTIAFWYRIPAVSGGKNYSMVSWGSTQPGATGHWSLGIERMAGNGSLRSRVGSGERSGQTAPAGNTSAWHHCAVVTDPAISGDQIANTRIYLDGEPVGTESLDGGPSLLPPTDHLLIGSHIVPGLPQIDALSADLDEFRLIHAALDKSAIRRLYEQNEISP